MEDEAKVESDPAKLISDESGSNTNSVLTGILPWGVPGPHLLSFLCAISDFLVGIPQGRGLVRTLHREN